MPSDLGGDSGSFLAPGAFLTRKFLAQNVYLLGEVRLPR